MEEQRTFATLSDFKRELNKIQDSILNEFVIGISKEGRLLLTYPLNIYHASAFTGSKTEEDCKRILEEFQKKIVLPLEENEPLRIIDAYLGSTR